MAAVGCLLPFLLAIGGAILGAMMAGDEGAIWGGLAGLVIGLAVPAVLFYALASARKDR